MVDYIKKVWDENAKKFKTSYEASWGDKFAINLEIDNISKNIKNEDKVLDVGCANGYSTIKQWEKNKSIKITGVDYSDNMIEHAQKNKENLMINNEDISFIKADIRNLPFDDNTFDIVYTTRVLINLPNWDEQKKGINECIRVAKKGGKIIFSEAFWEPLMLLNSIRILTKLDPLVEHDFNRYLRKSNLEKYLNELELKYINEDFSSVYYLGSRFLRELITDVNKYPGYSNPINEYFYNLEKEYSGGGFGIQQAYIIFK